MVYCIAFRDHGERLIQVAQERLTEDMLSAQCKGIFSPTSDEVRKEHNLIGTGHYLPRVLAKKCIRYTLKMQPCKIRKFAKQIHFA